MTDQPRWRKSSSSVDQGNCVELAELPDGVALRNSNHPDAGTLVVSRAGMAGFVAACRAGDLDDLDGS
jgi:ribosomal protein L2